MDGAGLTFVALRKLRYVLFKKSFGLEAGDGWFRHIHGSDCSTGVSMDGLKLWSRNESRFAAQDAAEVEKAPESGMVDFSIIICRRLVMGNRYTWSGKSVACLLPGLYSIARRFAREDRDRYRIGSSLSRTCST